MTVGMTPRFRKLNLTAHVVFSIGWIGAVGAFLVLSIAGITSRNPDVVRGSYISMDLVSRFAIIPMCFAALVTGIIGALGTSWGLFRYYWVAAKFGLTLLATVLLLVHQYKAIAPAAARVSGISAIDLFMTGFLPLKTELVRKSILAVVLLLGIAVLGIYKPWGLTAYGLRKQLESRGGEGESRDQTPLAAKAFFVVLGLLALVFVVLHLTGHGFGMHRH
jgi:hypothetical protein